jgi:hypothetical protein
VLVYCRLVSLPCALSLGQGQRSISWLSAVSMLCWFADCFSVLQRHLTLDITHLIWRFAFWFAICPVSGSGLSPAHCHPFCLSSLYLLKVHAEINSLLHFFLWGSGQSVLGPMLVYPSGSCLNTACHLFAHLSVCIFQAGF